MKPENETENEKLRKLVNFFFFLKGTGEKKNTKYCGQESESSNVVYKCDKRLTTLPLIGMGGLDMDQDLLRL